jgi:transposase InsO family protein
MNLIDQQYTATPFYGIRRMTVWLNSQGERVNHKRVARLIRQMGIEAIYPRPRTSKPGDNVRRYPYLLKGLVIEAHAQGNTPATIAYLKFLQTQFPKQRLLILWDGTSYHRS